MHFRHLKELHITDEQAILPPQSLRGNSQAAFPDDTCSLKFIKRFCEELRADKS